MKYLALVAALAALTSCNTAIGVGRDVKAGFNWTKGKIQGDDDAYYDDGGYDSGAPVY